jgi:spore photoproduct lyase
LPFFEQFEHVLLETRTKSANIEELILLARKGNVFKNTEIAFSLSPEPITNEYEKGTASLQKKLEAIQILLELKYRVGLRFLPLLPVENYWEVYEALIEEVKKHIDTAKISSIFIAPLIYNKGDFSVMKKVSSFPFLTALKENEN